MAQQALALARQHQERGNEAYAHRLLGEIAVHRNPLEATFAEGHYQQALELAEVLGMRPLAAYCHLGLGRLYAATGPIDRARVELTTASQLYRAMEIGFWLPQVEAAWMAGSTG